ncbi:MAG: hypothetical protein ACOC6H_04800, partial [Thermoproteota archaeon]
MSYSHRVPLITLAFILALSGIMFNWSVKAEREGLVLEWEQHWETYGVGGTCNFGTHNFFVGDIDNDGVIEMITGGITYNVSDGVRSQVKAPLRIWSWD